MLFKATDNKKILTKNAKTHRALLKKHSKYATLYMDYPAPMFFGVDNIGLNNIVLIFYRGKF